MSMDIDGALDMFFSIPNGFWFVIHGQSAQEVLEWLSQIG